MLKKDTKLASKIARIRVLQALGLNTPDYRFIFEYGHIGQHIFDHKKWSIRSQGPKDTKLLKKLVRPAFSNVDLTLLLEKDKKTGEPYLPPHFPVITAPDAFEALRIMIGEGYQAIICPCINPKDAEFAGAAIRLDNSINLEVADGPVMVRKVTREGKIDRRFDWNTINSDEQEIWDYFKEIYHDGRIGQVFIELLKMPKFHIIELSWYKPKVGWKPDHFVCWDLMPYDLYE